MTATVRKPHCRVVLQARMTSNRLPGKVLLPVCGMPIVVLATRRAGRDGLDTLVATSVESTDDPIERTLQEHGIRCVRGPLNDVLARYVQATADLDDNDICVRLTCDNVFPDSDFVRTLVASVEASAGNVGFVGGVDGLPFGLAGEAVRVGLLREAAAQTAEPYDREHVTPWVIRHYGRAAPSLPRLAGPDLSNLRCTVDTPEDYRTVSEALADVADPVAASWQELCQHLARWAERAAAQAPR